MYYILELLVLAQSKPNPALLNQFIVERTEICCIYMKQILK